MNLLVLSDSHGRADLVREALLRQRNPDALLFLGDGLRDLPDDLPCPIFSVRGNCDSFTFFDPDPAPEERLELLGGIRILLLHGHTRAVKGGFVRAIGAGLEADADIVCFGHTHEPTEYRLCAGEEFFGKTLTRPLLLFNPGSLREGSFGTLTIRPEGILPAHGQI